MLSSYIPQIVSSQIQDYLVEHELEDEKALVLKQKEIHGIPSSIIATQLSGRRKAKTKLPTWHKIRGIIYPPTINLEQCSSEATATFKTQIIHANLLTKRVAADITGGFGVDAFFLSSLFQSVHYAEPNNELFEITKHNHQQLGATNITHHCLTAERFMEETILDFDLIYIDPSRRSEKSQKVYKLGDCFPDITKIQSSLFDKSAFILLKTSPLLDIQQGLREIQQVKKVFVVSVGNECKEVLFLAEKNYEGEPIIEAIDLFENGLARSSFSFTVADEKNAQAALGEPNSYLYEPNASVLKSGAFKVIAQRFGLTKLDVSTHLYTSSIVVPDFPGKVFLAECLNPDAKKLKELLPDGKANVVSRNYPLSPDEIKRKLHLHDGGAKFLIGFSSLKRKHLALCSRVTGI